MPFTVITLTNVPPSLRGDLTKWMQEISTGVYVGNFNTAIREKLWERVKESARTGEATMSYACRNEIGYDFEIGHARRERIDCDGIPLVFIKKEETEQPEQRMDRGFSNAAKFRKAKRFSRGTKKLAEPYVVLDVETDGLDEKKHEIIEIGIVRVDGDKKDNYHALIEHRHPLPEKIVALTGITDQLLSERGRPLEDVLPEVMQFIGDRPIVGYNVAFDVKFLDRALRTSDEGALKNRCIDLKAMVKKEKQFLKSYTLQSVLKAYGIGRTVPHRALEDAEIIEELSGKVNEFLKFKNEKG
ncbi:MAG: type I-E CRISPR-associated endoribonuclease Cas2e [Peptoniphilus sp.]|nr:type I-E CRISPR-associated endoribonuclease Cas2e [Peptoniphilus sp.]MDD7363432.1 type I-E CRISPR-associated endoribonuclease Cas2e [Bacillota bacterium]MDY6044434.1 type I-E CRISPR-associated endoribonuclease Cas2e [Peptoniphilus sp.]